MNYAVELPTENHDAEWLEHYGDRGGLNIVCGESSTAPGEGPVVIVAAGWGHIDVCPVCGAEIDLSTEEL